MDRLMRMMYTVRSLVGEMGDEGDTPNVHFCFDTLEIYTLTSYVSIDLAILLMDKIQVATGDGQNPVDYR